MTTDLYTKAVLTVIAVALSGIAIQLTTKDAHAQSQGLRFAPSGALMITICDTRSYMAACRDLDGSTTRMVQ